MRNVSFVVVRGFVCVVCVVCVVGACATPAPPAPAAHTTPPTPAAATPPATTTTALDELGLTPAERVIWDDAGARMRAGQNADGWRRYHELLRPDAPSAVLSAICHASIRPGVVADDRAAVCRRLLDSTTDVDSAAVAVTGITDFGHAGGDDDALFRELMTRWRASPAQTPSTAHNIARLAVNAQHMSVVEDVLAGDGAPAAQALLWSATRYRSHMALPRGAVRADDEPEAFAAIGAVRRPELTTDELTTRLDAVVQRFGELPATLVLRADLLRRDHKLAEADAALDRSAQLFDSAFVHVVRGLVRYEQKRPADAIVELQRAYVLDPADPNIHDTLTEMLRRAGRAADADAVAPPRHP